MPDPDSYDDEVMKLHMQGLLPLHDFMVWFFTKVLETELL